MVSVSDVMRNITPCITGADKQLRLVILGDERINEEREVVAIEVDEEEESLECKTVWRLGIFDEELSGVKTMRMEGLVKGVPVMVLIDSGASHYFVSPTVALALGLPVDKAYKLGVRLGDGHRIITKGKCPEIVMKLDDSKFTTDAYVMELGGVDVILDVVWRCNVARKAGEDGHGLE